MSPKTLLGPFGPILGGGQARIFLSPFGPKKAQNFFSEKKFYLHYFDSQRVWDPQKPKIDPVDPPSGPHFGPFCVQNGRFWGQKTRFSQKKILFQIIFYRFPDGVGPSKTQNWPFIPPRGPHLVPFGGHFGPIWGKKKNEFFSKIFFCSKSFFIGSQMVGDPQKPKIGPLYPLMVPK